MLRWGVLSAAKIAREQVISAIQLSRNGKVVAIAARDPKRAQAVAEHFAIATIHASYEALLEAPGVDAIYIPLKKGNNELMLAVSELGGWGFICRLLDLEN